jgi:hypothetical protein
MNSRPNQERLLADVLAAGSASGYREALLNETLGLVRRRRRTRRAWRAAYTVALIVALGVLLLRSPGPGSVAPGFSMPYTMVLSQPLAAAAIVSTQPFAGSIIESGQSVELVQTASSGLRPNDINDIELLTLLGSKPVALVRRAPHKAELVFVNEEDEEALFRN